MKTAIRSIVACALLLSFASYGASEGNATDSTVQGETPPNAVIPSVEILGVDLVTPWKPSDACVQTAAELLGKMTLVQKAGQMTQVAMRYVEDLNDLATYDLGSMLAGGSDFPGEDLSAVGWAAYIDNAKQIAVKSELGIPLLFGIDAVHGNGKTTGAVVFPHNIGLGCTGDPILVQRTARVTAMETRGSGVDWAFSPVLAAALDERWGRTYEAFGETSELAAEYGVAMVLGLQGASLGQPSSALACVKHFAGDGATRYGTSHMENAVFDRGNVEMSYEQFYDVAIRQYIPSINAGAGTVMISYSSFQGTKMHGERHLITDILKGELGFAGFVISDWKGIDDIPGPFEKDVEVSVNAGIDMVMVPDRYKEFIAVIEKLVPEKIPVERVDDAVRRILQVKCEMGMFDENYSPETPPDLTASVGSAVHRAVAREAVAKSLVVLKNDGILPLKKGVRVHVAGSGAKNLDMQCGGWTVTWGGEGSRTEGTTVLQAVEKVSRATYSSDAQSIPEGAKFGIVVVGEKPYAEWKGDREELFLEGGDQKAIENMKKSGLPYVVVLFSGRPMIVTNEIDNANGFVAAWLPGTEGDGIADVLFGDVKPTGKLSHSWPENMAQIPINFGDAGLRPVVPSGLWLDLG